MNLPAPAIAVVVALVYGAAGFLVVQLSETMCRQIEPFEDGPPPGKPPTALLIAGCAVIGGLLGALQPDAPLPKLGMLAIICVSLAGAWYCDVRTGIIPDFFTLVPLGAVLLYAFVAHDVQTMVAIALIGVPFAVAALVSRGRGMGWGDVKLAALGGAALGWQMAIVAFSGACLVAVALAFLRNRRHQPIAFAPYLVAAIAVGLVLQLGPSHIAL